MDTIIVCPVVLAGGAGTRLWPLSREDYPKQLLRLKGDNTLLQDTMLRLDGLETEKQGHIRIRPPVIVGNEEHRFLMTEQLQSISRAPDVLLLEPASRNTAPALTVAALHAVRSSDDPVLLVMPADQVIDDRIGFHDAIATGARAVGRSNIVTFGIVADRPETGYGYIKKGMAAFDTGRDQNAFVIDAFREKPDRVTAQGYLDSGDYLWNAGLFMVRASTWLTLVDQMSPQVKETSTEAYEAGEADGVFFHLGKVFESCPSDSIDYAVMEPLTARQMSPESPGEGATRALVVPMDVGWSDVGSWSALLQLNRTGENGSACDGDVYEVESIDNVLISTHRLVVAIGLRDTVVVETGDAVLVADQRHAQSVKDVVTWLKSQGRDEGTSHRRVYRPWGDYEQLDDGDRFQVKRLTVKPGSALSLQMHHHRAEHWIVVRGTARVTRGEETFLLSENESTYIPLGVKHRLENPGTVTLEVIEVQSGSYLGEDDIVRFDDRYNRG